jgi:hypothetical protein
VILFTGGSSFTGYWFIKELASAGHEFLLRSVIRFSVFRSAMIFFSIEAGLSDWH